MSKNVGKDLDVVAAGSAGAVRPAVESRSAAASNANHGLVLGSAYRITYTVGTYQHRRVTHSIGHFEGMAARRRWTGDDVMCLDFTLPHGRTLSLLRDQLIEARPAAQNDRGQWILDPEAAPAVPPPRGMRGGVRGGRLGGRSSRRRATNPLRLAG